MNLEIALREGFRPSFLRMPIEHDGQVLVNGHQMIERLAVEQFLRASQ